MKFRQRERVKTTLTDLLSLIFKSQVKSIPDLISK